jgi:hypothetical protein
MSKQINEMWLPRIRQLPHGLTEAGPAHAQCRSLSFISGRVLIIHHVGFAPKATEILRRREDAKCQIRTWRSAPAEEQPVGNRETGGALSL